ncbi:hypothetical protein EJ05DRAFT_490808 [Pseudovirgaria hyperparasitica]|uniref:Uncharacterized protein n=1 Tax=Pseudovirgaria hyperparasitica TaxID=470096 RepID=A0A6A6VQU0_9PEZI|nr:uncharacterized protein EJ05DRAFT_490808 [Pseudovirgaria hyperparasitica]KAF2752563.1 hypothetical protein EJ05DRAFT_490808 [Pseudovirgaria hyperparasitica]
MLRAPSVSMLEPRQAGAKSGRQDQRNPPITAASVLATAVEGDPPSLKNTVKCNVSSKEAQTQVRTKKQRLPTATLPLLSFRPLPGPDFTFEKDTCSAAIIDLDPIEDFEKSFIKSGIRTSGRLLSNAKTSFRLKSIPRYHGCRYRRLSFTPAHNKLLFQGLHDGFSSRELSAGSSIRAQPTKLSRVFRDTDLTLETRIGPLPKAHFHSRVRVSAPRCLHLIRGRPTSHATLVNEQTKKSTLVLIDEAPEPGCSVHLKEHSRDYVAKTDLQGCPMHVSTESGVGLGRTRMNSQVYYELAQITAPARTGTPSSMDSSMDSSMSEMSDSEDRASGPSSIISHIENDEISYDDIFQGEITERSKTTQSDYPWRPCQIPSMRRPDAWMEVYDECYPSSQEQSIAHQERSMPIDLPGVATIKRTEPVLLQVQLRHVLTNPEYQCTAKSTELLRPTIGIGSRFPTHQTNELIHTRAKSTQMRIGVFRWPRYSPSRMTHEDHLA